MKPFLNFLPVETVFEIVRIPVAGQTELEAVADENVSQPSDRR